jgi:hypothetical protein
MWPPNFTIRHIKNVMKNKLMTLVSIAAVAAALTQTSQAVPITGNVGFSGAVQLNSTSVQTATEALAWYETVVNGQSGSFSGIANGTPVALATPWFFNSGTLNNFWTVGGFTFNLASSHIFSQDALFLNIVLAGTVTASGFDPTAFTGTFQVANPPANGSAIFTERFSFSSVRAVPEGGATALLLGVTLVAMALIKHKLSQPASPRLV